jgi:pSer/pThr/pTyr-binding forkhead associated (FHA) protein
MDLAPQSSHGETISIRGIHGWSNGTLYPLGDGDALVIGRSRSCDISLRRTEGYLDQPRQNRDHDVDFNTVSRRHVRIKLVRSVLIIEDLSTNGTWINGERLENRIDVDISRGPIELRLGNRETFRIGGRTDSSQPALDVRGPGSSSNVRSPSSSQDWGRRPASGISRP